MVMFVSLVTAPGGSAGTVRRDRERLSATCDEVFRECVETLDAPCPEHDGGAFRRKEPGGRLAKPAARAGDDDDLALDVRHDVPDNRSTTCSPFALYARSQCALKVCFTIMALSPSLLPQLHVFLAVARLRNFSGAARELGVSPSAVSQAVRQLEEQLRVTLLTRTTRSVALTDPGRRLVDSADPAVRQAFVALSEVSARPGETVGRVRLSVPQVAVQFVLAPMLAQFRERNPRAPRSDAAATTAVVARGVPTTLVIDELANVHGTTQAVRFNFRRSLATAGL
jgi:DNA-binding MarR family transcriptional regulator